MKLTDRQLETLRHCAKAGRLWCTSENLWRWHRSLPNGMVTQVATSPTIYTLQQKKLLKRSTANSVEITPAGLSALEGDG